MNFNDEIRILIIEPASEKKINFANALKDISLSINYVCCDNADEGKQIIEDQLIDLCFIRLHSDHSHVFPDLNSLSCADATVPLILLCDHTELHIAMELLKADVFDFIFDHALSAAVLQKTIFCAAKYRTIAKERSRAGSTENRIAEGNLEKLSLIARESINAFVVTDESGIVNWLNKSFHTITGYSENETVGKSFPKLLRALGSEEISVRYISRQIYRQSAFEADVLIYTKDGKKKWLQIHCQPQNTGSNKSFFAVITDISRDKEIELLLKASEKRFRSIIEKSSEGITLTDKNGIVIEMSGAGKMILGYKKEELYENVGMDLIHPDDAADVQRIFSEVQNGPGLVLHAQYRFQKPDGNYIWLESVFHNLLSEPEINAVVIHFRDITERKYFEAVLKNSEANYRNLFNNNPSAIFIWDPLDLSIIEANDSARTEYGYSSEEFVAGGMQALLQPADIHLLREYGMQIASGAINNVSYTVPHIFKSYNLQLMEVTCSGINYFGKKAALAIVNNITEKVNLEMRLAEERKERQNEITQAVITAQEQERIELGKELHDNINQILATTKLYIEHAQENNDKRDELLTAARGFISAAVGEIRMLTKSLAPPSLGELGLFSALDELINTIEPVNDFYVRSFWLLQSDSYIPVSLRLTIFRIVQEQLTNISKHAAAKNVEIMIFPEAEFIKIKITDDGKGFDIHAKRSGVGLKNIYSRANLHGGTVDLQSSEGRGCILEISFKMQAL